MRLVVFSASLLLLFGTVRGFSETVFPERSDACEGFAVSGALVRDGSGAVLGIDPSQLEIAILAGYHQAQYQLVDSLGDYVLAATTRTLPKKIWYSLLRRKDKLDQTFARYATARPCAHQLFGITDDLVPPIFEDYAWQPSERELGTIYELPVDDEIKFKLADGLLSGRLYLEGHHNPIRVKNFKRMFEQVIYEEYSRNGIQPSLGNVHDWSPEFMSKYGWKFFPYTAYSKILLALSRGTTGMYLRTGTESELQDEIISRPRASVTIPELFRASYRINRGDVYLTLLTIENVLARYWRTENRESLAMTQRLTPIINAFGKKADKFGSWYHLFGMMLYGYSKGMLAAKMVAHTESIGSHILDGFADEKQEDYINAKGATLGADLLKIVKKASYLSRKDDPSVLDSRFYLDLDEDFSNRLTEMSRPPTPELDAEILRVLTSG